MSGITYDTTVLIAAERGDRQMWSRHQGLLRLGAVPVVPAPVLAQAWRGGSRQAMLARLLAGCEIEAMTEESARAVGRLLGAAAHDDVVDAAVVESAARRTDSIVTSDLRHIERLVTACKQNLVIEVVSHRGRDDFCDGLAATAQDADRTVPASLCQVDVCAVSQLQPVGLAGPDVNGVAGRTVAPS